MSTIMGEKTVGELLSERRSDLRGKPQYLSQAQMTKVLKEQGYKKVSQGRISMIENDLSDIMNLQPSERLALLRLYDYSDKAIIEISERFSLDLDVLLRHREYDSTLKSVTTGPTVRYFGTVNGGLEDADIAERGEEVFVPDWIVERFDLSRVFAMDVMGDSMTCEDVKKSIPENSRVYFLEAKSAHEGEIVCCRLHNEGVHVLKVFKKQEGYTVLASYNHQHEPIFISEENPGTLLGVYLTHIPRGPRLR